MPLIAYMFACMSSQINHSAPTTSSPAREDRAYKNTRKPEHQNDDQQRELT